MKALTVWQPWASLLVHGVKKHETRSWSTSHRGHLAIHAAKRKPPDHLEADQEFLSAVSRLSSEAVVELPPFRQLPRGAVLGVVDVVDVLPTEDARIFGKSWEHVLGDFSDDRYAWKVEPVEVFEEPIPARGSQRLWTWSHGALTGG